MDDAVRTLLELARGDRRLPSWAVEQLDSALESGDPTGHGITVERERPDRSYLEFLDQQIELEPRGPAWAAVLRARRAAIAPFVDDELLRLAIRSGEDEVVVRARESPARIVHVEVP